MKWIINWIVNNEVLAPRISRKKFIRHILLAVLCYTIFLTCVIISVVALHLSETVTRIISIPARLVGWIFIYYIYLAVVARCHDLGKSGWWFWVPFYFIALFVKEGIPYPNKFDKESELYEQKIKDACEYAFNLREQNKNVDEIKSLIKQKFKFSKAEINVILANCDIYNENT